MWSSAPTKNRRFTAPSPQKQRAGRAARCAALPAFFGGESMGDDHSLIPSIDKGKHGFDGQKCAHTASSPLAIRQVLPAGLFLSGHISAPTKLLAPASDVFSSDFWFLRRGLAGASQGEKGKKRRKDTLSGVFALVNRWYSYRNSPGCRRWACPCRRCRWSGRTANRSGR